MSTPAERIPTPEIRLEAFAADPGKVVHETIEGEAILIHLETGCYYSVDGAGAEIWAMLAAGHAVDDVARAIEVRYTAAPGTVAAEVRRLAAELVDEGLLDPTELPSGDGLPTGEGEDPKEFVPPVLRKYTEMQDFLLVDPIHETTDAGWPERA